MKAYSVYLSVIAALFLFGLTSIASAQKIDEYNLNQTYSIDENGTIELRTDDADIVEITGSDRNDVHLVVDYHLTVECLTLGDREKFEMQVTERDGNLVIQEKPRNSSFNINLGRIEEDYTIRIEAPRGVNLNLDGDDDIYEITNITGSINVDADDSEIMLNRCQGEEFEFDLDDGKLTMDGGYGLLNIDIDDGEVDVRNGRFRRLNLDMDDADIHLATTLADDGDYDFSSDDGSIDFIVLGGGGEIWVDHDEINVSASSEFEETRSNEDYNEYRLRVATLAFASIPMMEMFDFLLGNLVYYKINHVKEG